MRYIIGLGNPGKEYQWNRHNVGFLFLDFFVNQLSFGNFTYNNRFKADLLKEGDMVLVKPMNYMNNSGQITRSIIDFYDKQVPLDEVVVIHDDLDIELGEYKVQKGKGPKVHNGLKDLEAHLGSDDFWHVRIGIDGRSGDRSVPGSSYVLSNFTDKEKEVIREVFSEALTDLKAVIDN